MEGRLASQVGMKEELEHHGHDQPRNKVEKNKHRICVLYSSFGQGPEEEPMCRRVIKSHD